MRLKFPFFAAGFLGEVHIFGSHQSTNWPQFISYFSQSNPFFSWGKTLIADKTLKSGKIYSFLTSQLLSDKVSRWRDTALEVPLGRGGCSFFFDFSAGMITGIPKTERDVSGDINGGNCGIIS